MRDRVAERRAATRREILEAAWDIVRETGLSQLTLRDVATRIGMQAPSLYSHFESKLAIYDGMYAMAWADYEATRQDLDDQLPADDPREVAYLIGRHFYDYAATDLPRHQLMNQRIIPGFEPTAESYAPAVRVLERNREVMCGLGDISSDDFDVWVALVGGLVSQHYANDPEGLRYVTLLRRAVDMWADSVGLPPSPVRRRATRRKVVVR